MNARYSGRSRLNIPLDPSSSRIKVRFEDEDFFGYSFGLMRCSIRFSIVKLCGAGSSWSKTEVVFENKRDFLGFLLNLWDLLHGVRSVPEIPQFQFFP